MAVYTDKQLMKLWQDTLPTAKQEVDVNWQNLKQGIDNTESTTQSFVDYRLPRQINIQTDNQWQAIDNNLGVIGRGQITYLDGVQREIQMFKQFSAFCRMMPGGAVKQAVKELRENHHAETGEITVWGMIDVLKDNDKSEIVSNQAVGIIGGDFWFVSDYRVLKKPILLTTNCARFYCEWTQKQILEDL